MCYPASVIIMNEYYVNERMSEVLNEHLSTASKWADNERVDEPVWACYDYLPGFPFFAPPPPLRRAAPPPRSRWASFDVRSSSSSWNREEEEIVDQELWVIVNETTSCLPTPGEVVCGRRWSVWEEIVVWNRQKKKSMKRKAAGGRARIERARGAKWASRWVKTERIMNMSANVIIIDIDIVYGSMASS